MAGASASPSPPHFHSGGAAAQDKWKPLLLFVLEPQLDAGGGAGTFCVMCRCHTEAGARRQLGGLFEDDPCSPLARRPRFLLCSGLVGFV